MAVRPPKANVTCMEAPTEMGAVQIPANECQGVYAVDALRENALLVHVSPPPETVTVGAPFSVSPATLTTNKLPSAGVKLAVVKFDVPVFLMLACSERLIAPAFEEGLQNPKLGPASALIPESRLRSKQ